MESIKILASCGLWEDGIVEEALKSHAVSFQVSHANNITSENIDDVFVQKECPDYVLVKAETLEYPLQEGVSLVALLMAKEEGRFYALVGSSSCSRQDEYIQRLDVRKSWGEVYITGFGPGDALLMTKMAEYTLQNADVIFYDDLVNEGYLQRLSIPLMYVGKRKGKHKFDQQKINELMLEEARKGKSVVRVKGGDPLLFGRGAEEFHFLAKNFIRAEIIPGISSAFAVASSSVIPLTERSLSSSVTFLSGHDLNKLRIPKSDTLVFYMGASNQSAIAARLLDEEWHPGTPVAIVHNVSSNTQKEYRCTIKELAEKSSDLPSPSIIIVGKTARKYSDKPAKILYTGVHLNDWEREGDIVHTPMVKFQRRLLLQEEMFVLKNLSAYDRIIFKNRHSVDYFMESLFDLGLDVRSLSGIKINSIGDMTSVALRKYGLLINPFTPECTSSSFVNVCRELNVEGENIIIPGSDYGSSQLSEGLKGLKNNVHDIAFYHMEKNDAIVKQNLDLFKGVIFTSPATIDAFIDVYGTIPAHLNIECIGTRTKEKIEEIVCLKTVMDVL